MFNLMKGLGKLSKTLNLDLTSTQAIKDRALLEGENKCTQETKEFIRIAKELSRPYISLSRVRDNVIEQALRKEQLDFSENCESVKTIFTNYSDDQTYLQYCADKKAEEYAVQQWNAKRTLLASQMPQLDARHVNILTSAILKGLVTILRLKEHAFSNRAFYEIENQIGRLKLTEYRLEDFKVQLTKLNEDGRLSKENLDLAVHNFDSITERLSKYVGDTDSALRVKSDVGAFLLKKIIEESTNILFALSDFKREIDDNIKYLKNLTTETTK